MKKIDESGDLIKGLRKMMLMMKLTTFLLLVFVMHLSASVYSQRTKLSIDMRGQSIKEVLQTIESQTDFRFIYENEKVNLDSKVNLQVEQKSVEDILKMLFVDRGIQYSITRNNLILINPSGELPAMVQQPKTINGKVTDSSGIPLPGVTVVIQGTTQGTISGADGSYFLANVPADATLVFSFVGMRTQEIPVAGKTSINVMMDEETIGLEEVVAVGYGTQRKKDITGAVAIVDVQSMKSIPTGSAIKALQGQASGVNIISNGAPGSSSQIFIRGIGSFGDTRPLVLVDGVESNLDNINSNEIESIQVLKDAGAASIYGVRGSNGVIIVTTKRGKAGTMSVSYDAYASVQMPFGGNPLNMANTEEYAKIWSVAFPSEGSFANGVPDYMYRSPGSPAQWAFSGDPAVDPSKYNFDDGDANNNYIISKVSKPGTNWYQEIFDPALSQNHNVTVNGGTEKSRYLFSVNYLDENGALIKTFNKRYSARVNTDFNIGKNIRIGENAYLYYINRNGYSNSGEYNAITNCVRAPSYVPVYDISGMKYSATFNSPIVGNFKNPVAVQELQKNNRNLSWTMVGNVYAEIDFLKHFTLRTSYGGSITGSYSVGFGFKPYWDTEGFASNNSLSETSGYDKYQIWTNTLYYKNIFGKHRINGLLGSETIKYDGRSVTGSRQDYYSQDFNYLLLQNGSSTIDNSSSAYDNRLFSLFGRIDYSFNDKYLLGVSVRRDGSSKFGPNKRYGIFPSVSLGWQVSEEAFMKGVDWLDNLKIRGSYGVLGNQSNISTGNAFSSFTSNMDNSYYDIAGTNNSSQIGFYQGTIGNLDTSWEKDIVTNIGFDMAILGRKIEISAEYYKKSIEGLLFSEPLPAVVGGAAAPTINIGDIQNTGFDISGIFRGKIGNELSFTISPNITTYNNKVVSIPGTAGYFDTGSTRIGNLVRNQQGHPVSSFFGYDVIGLFQSPDDVAASPTQSQAGPGQFKYRNVDGDEEISPDDRTFIGNPNPDFTYGINLALKYGNLDFSAMIYGSQGNEVVNFLKWYNYYTSWYHNGISRDLLNAWSAENPTSTIPAVLGSTSFSENSVPNSWYVEDGSFLKLRSVVIGYSLPDRLLQPIAVQKLRFYVQAENLFQITNYSGLDPEVPGSSSNFGIDFGNYPNNHRKFIVGVNLTF